MPYQISTKRVLLLVVLSYSIYLYYWFWLTWKQYRDHTGHRVFPAWHTLALGVPVYGLFRVHGHMASYNQLMLRAGLTTTINPWFVVALILISMVISVAAAVLYFWSISPSGGIAETGPPSGQIALIKLVLDVVVAVLAAWLLTYVQPKVNAYWGSLPVATGRGLGTGEIICLVIGILAWTSGALSVVAVS